MKRTTSGCCKLPAMKPGQKPRRRHVHKHLVGLFAVAAVFLVILNIAVILTPSHPVQATSAESFDGWAWSSTGGWLSMNDTSVGSGGGSYGVTVNPATKAVTGYAWSSNQGWVCFGSSCAGTTPAGGGATASIDGSNKLRGWAKFLNLTDPDGWVSLNCLDTGGGGSCGTSNYGPIENLSTGVFGGYAWHGLGGGLGWGWIDFSAVRIYEGTLDRCHDTIDNNVNGAVDCADDACRQQPALLCPAVETQCNLISRVNCCYNGDDDDNDALVDCADNDCNAQSCGSGCECGGGVKTETVAACGDGADNDADALTDCNDVADCASYAGCVPEICDNLVDDNANGQIDCDDATCGGFPACTPAWLKSQYGNVYSTLGISGNAPPPGQTNATYCLTSAGTVTNFTSTEGCVEASQPTALTLPSGGSGYVSNLGRLDVTGILSGRYGAVVPIASDASLPAILDGKVYVYDKDAQGGACPSGLDFVLNAKTFNNGNGATQRGNGLLVIKGCNLRISGNLSYQAAGVSTYLRNLASFGVLVLAKYNAGAWVSGGDISIDPAVGQIVGLSFGERTIRTGTTGAADIQLNVYGALVGHEVLLQRRYGSPTEAAEDVVFDGRGIVNPPPGTQDITKSLPSLRDTF